MYCMTFVARHGAGGVNAVVAAGGAHPCSLLEEEASAAAKVEDVHPRGERASILEGLHDARCLKTGPGWVWPQRV